MKVSYSTIRQRIHHQINNYWVIKHYSVSFTRYSSKYHCTILKTVSTVIALFFVLHISDANSKLKTFFLYTSNLLIHTKENQIIKPTITQTYMKNVIFDCLSKKKT